MKVSKEFTFDSAHFLPKYYGKCERMHGHTYRLIVTVEGDVNENGLVMDFVVLKKIVKNRVLDKLDHQVLNDIIDIPSAENITVWIWNELVNLESHIKEELGDPNLPECITKYFKDKEDGNIDISEFTEKIKLAKIKLWETPTSSVSYNGK